MPLHLLGKKSWNVYNKDSIERVRRDEAAAEIRDKEEQRRTDRADAESRLQFLRDARDTTDRSRQDGQEEDVAQTRRLVKKRRLEGEDDTDRDIRLAQQVGVVDNSKKVFSPDRQKAGSLADGHGHFSLFPETDVHKSKGNAEVAAESAKRQQDLEDQYTMRLANAAGKDAGSDKPWYSAPAGNDYSTSTPALKNVWGRADPRRHEREKRRLDSSDPLATIKKAVKQIRETDREREQWRAQREQDLNEAEDMAKKHKSHRKRRRSSAKGSLDGFDLNEGYDQDHAKRRKSKELSTSRRRRRKDDSRAHRDDRGRS